MRKRIIIQDIDLPKKRHVKNDVHWICNSLGLISGRDIENTCFKIMREMLGFFSEESLVSTETISKSLKIECPRINHHIRGLMESGIIYREKRKIALRGGSLSSAIEEMKRESNQMFDRLLEISKKIDKRFDL